MTDPEDSRSSTGDLRSVTDDVKSDLGCVTEDVGSVMEDPGRVTEERLGKPGNDTKPSIILCVMLANVMLC